MRNRNISETFQCQLVSLQRNNAIYLKILGSVYKTNSSSLPIILRGSALSTWMGSMCSHSFLRNIAHLQRKDLKLKKVHGSDERWNSCVWNWQCSTTAPHEYGSLDPWQWAISCLLQISPYNPAVFASQPPHICTSVKLFQLQEIFALFL